jgi:hypothetical protein
MAKQMFSNAQQSTFWIERSDCPLPHMKTISLNGLFKNPNYKFLRIGHFVLRQLLNN